MDRRELAHILRTTRSSTIREVASSGIRATLTAAETLRPRFGPSSRASSSKVDREFSKSPFACDRRIRRRHRLAIMAGASDKARFYLEQYVPELQEYERKHIFSRDEITAVTSKRSDFEHI